MPASDERVPDCSAEVIDSLGEPAARDPLRLLEADDGSRADAFRQFHERGGQEPLLDALANLEGDLVMRGWLVEHLRVECVPSSASPQWIVGAGGVGNPPVREGSDHLS